MHNGIIPTLSVIIAAYNAEHTLRRCIDSVLDLCDTAIEVIISNDGSTDQTQQIIDEYTAKDPRVIGICNNNGGVSCNRNRGIRIAKGDWITFVDADDFVAPGIYRKVSDVLEKHQPDLLEYQYFVHGEDSAYPVSPNQLPKDVLLDRSCIRESILPVMLNLSDKKEYFIESFVWNKVYRARLIKEHGIFFDEERRKWEDRLFSITFLRYANSYYSMSEYGYYYVCGGTQTLSSTYSPDILKIIMDSYQKYRMMYDDMYSFDNLYTTNYFCNLLINVASEQFSYQLPVEELMRIYSIFTEDPTVQRLFRECTLSESAKQKICTAVQERNIQAIYRALRGYYLRSTRNKRHNAVFGRIRGILSMIKSCKMM